ncbi:hypothetical protein SUDANB6_02298 [Streptomyces sp. enrichment culture]|uniref:hypothetical protein n=1 Tax=Streptomyces sp. enrichment culture TaxID=1795815 RepID=UPI003F54A6D2
MTGGEAPADRAGTEAEMGDQRRDGGATAPRRARPDRDPGSVTVPGRRTGPPGPDDGAPGPVEALLSAALRAGGDDAGGERRAVAAFRAARDAGAHRAARTRRRDDWRPRARRRAGRPLKAALSVLLAGLVLGGAAYAAIGGGPAADGARGERSRPSAAPVPTDGPVPRPAATSPGAVTGPGNRPAGGDVTADCRAYERIEGRGGERGGKRDAAAWRRLPAAAGGERRIDAYCARLEAGREVREDGRRDGRPAGRPVEGNGSGGAGRGGAGGATAVGGPGRPGTSGDPGGSADSGDPGGGTANAGEGAAGNGHKAGRDKGR